MDICRVCMDEVDNFSSIFDVVPMIKKELTPATLITECSGVDISRNDGLPELACSACLQELVQAYIIRDKCIASDRKLRKILFFRNPEKEKDVNVITSDQIESTEIITVKTLQLVNDVSRDSCEMKQGGLEDEFGNFDHILTPVEAPLLSIEADFTVKKESDEANGSYFDEEYLVEDVPESSEDETNEAALDGNVDLVDKETIKMEVEIVKRPVRNLTRLDNDNTNVGSASETESKKFACVLCGQELTTKGNLKSHMKLHNNERPYVCEICGREFSKKGNYKVHLTRHSSNRAHACTVCDMSFVCHINLKNHMRKHTGERPYVCQYCNKSFMYLSDINRHKYLHTGEYPFSCELCAKKFSRASLLKKHQERKCSGKQGSKRKEMRLKTEVEVPYDEHIPGSEQPLDEN